jgi:TonB family protein
VEVVAGDKHKKLHPGTNSTHVEIPKPAANADNLAPATNAAEREPLPAAPAPQASANTSYPLLAQHMNVQGSVVLQAVISAEGVVQDLRVLSGPAILSSAAQQAVREWRFKPVVQNGQAVETKAKITVNFSIKVADNSASTTLAESRASDILVVSR